MQRKRLTILKKVSNLLKTSICVAKMRKPITAKLVFLKKTRKLKRFKLLRHYNNRFLEEYEFSSASSTPLIHYQKKHFLKNSSNGGGRLGDVYSMLSLCRCFGIGGLKSEGVDYSLAMETLPAITRDQFVEPAVRVMELDDNVKEEEDSVDQRAERFIQWFYQEMRMQRHDVA
ncbi:hypothetical protein Pint_22015 [Pistacia integerrima]|uniref:Uncharacterized protein n=1 Tax=Pistacia integerrima TaxID=434235 RepID=A0ACC0YHN4_9ROSI|nr:hypothetical protein Pint_22015 [Pistacia integerrima]